MGRMLETFKPNELKNLSGPESRVPDAKNRSGPEPPPAPVSPNSDAEEYLFIEVGGPDKKIDASPAVLAAPGPAGRSAGSPLPEKRTEARTTNPAGSAKPPSAALAPTLTAAGPMAIHFEAWPLRHAGGAVAPEIITYHHPEHPISKQYGELVAKMLEDPQARVVIGAGAMPQAGTTTVMLNVAFSACRGKGQRVAVVEGHLARPALAVRLGLGAIPGLQDVLAGKLALETAVVATGQPALHVLTAGAHPNDGKILVSEAFPWLLAWLRERFDIILVDAPDLSAAEALAPLAAAGDAFYLVLPEQALPPQIHVYTQTVSRLRGRLRGLIHTHFENV